MGGSTHALRTALGRNFDQPPNWRELCPPFEAGLNIRYEDEQLMVFSHILHLHDVHALILNVLGQQTSFNPDDFSLFLIHQDDQSSAVQRRLESWEKPLDDIERLEKQGYRPFLILTRSSLGPGSIPSGSKHDIDMRSAMPKARHPSLFYRLNRSAQHDIRRYPIAHDAMYDTKGRPISVPTEDRQSREVLEQQMVEAQNSVVMVSARRLGHGENSDQPEQDIHHETR